VYGYAVNRPSLAEVGLSKKKKKRRRKEKLIRPHFYCVFVS